MLRDGISDTGVRDLNDLEIIQVCGAYYSAEDAIGAAESLADSFGYGDMAFYQDMPQEGWGFEDNGPGGPWWVVVESKFWFPDVGIYCDS